MTPGATDVQDNWELLIHRGEPRDGLRFGAPPLAYVAPLSVPLRGRTDLALVEAMPDVLLRDLSEGALDCALLPVLDCVRVMRGRVIPGVGVCSRGASQAAILRLRTTASEVQRIAFDPQTSGAVGLGQVILAEQMGRAHQFVACDGGLSCEENVDAALVTGGLPQPWADFGDAQIDLSATWTALTGLPLVHALWLGRPGAPYPKLRQVIGLAARAVEREDNEGPGAAPYFTVGSEEMQAARILLQVAAHHGLCEAGVRIQLC